ncbi:MAG: S8 family serine peptidase [Clostridia bacterium]|nr:S8 family serine peptidase [Clostridia bacterium]
MKHFRTRLFVILTTLALIISFGAVSASQNPCEEGENRVTVIVEVEGDAVLAAKNASKLGAKEFLKTSEAEKIENKARSVQASVFSEAQAALGEELNVIFSYTHVLNGFATEIDADKVASLYALPNVKKVYVQENTYTLASPEKSEVEAEFTLTESAESEGNSGESENKTRIVNGGTAMNIQYMHENGYTGKGMVIAIVDADFDPGHEMFRGPVANPRLSRDDIMNLLRNESLSIKANGVTGLYASRFYRSDKVPYAFNYYTLTADTLSSGADHGLHVAGIAAGSNGVFNGERYVGAAPDAQILFMDCSIGGSGINTPAELAAIEDAVKLGADVINHSISYYYNYSDELNIRITNTVRNAGIMLATSAGNYSRGPNGQVNSDEAVPAKMADYSPIGHMTDLSASTAVANVESPEYVYEYYYFYKGEEEIVFVPWYDHQFYGFAGVDKDVEYVYVNDADKSDFENVNVKGKIAFANQFDIPFAEKMQNAADAGAVGIMIVYDYDKGLDVEYVISGEKAIPFGILSIKEYEKFSDDEDKTVRFPYVPECFMLTRGISMSSLSSWDTANDLELKPEISAIGGEVYSATYDNGYKNYSGTSMAAPFYAGISALMFEYMAANPSKYAPFGNRATLAENIFMSTANVVYQDEDEKIPYSPRKQGAGLVDAEKAVKTPVFLLGDELEAGEYVFRKAKISLRQLDLENGDTFKLSFTAQNMTDEDVTYDKLSMCVITDGADENGMTCGMKKLTFTSDLPDFLTVPASSSVDLTVKVTLDKDELEENLDVFVNGFYIDGFVFLEDTSLVFPDLSIPFTGFYGDWYHLPLVDKGWWDEDSWLAETGAVAYSSIAFPGNNGNATLIGKNLFDMNNVSLAKREYIGFSPNFDGEADEIQFELKALRKLGQNDFAVCDTDGNELLHKVDMDLFSNGIYYTPIFGITFLGFSEEECKSLPDGDYIFKAYSNYRFIKPYEQETVFECPFYLDRVSPEIKEFSVNGDTLTLSLADNRYLMGYILSGTSGGEPKTETFALEPAKLCETTADISGYDSGSLTVEVYDYALNRTTASELPPTVTLQERHGKEFTFGIENKKDEEIPCTFTMVAYLNGRPVKITSGGGAIPRGESSKIINFDVEVYDRIKLFVWDSLEGMKPVCEQVEID